MRFAISYAPPFRVLASALGMSPSQSGVTVEDDHLEIRMGWAFHARIPRGMVRLVEQPVKIPALLGWGVHGWAGRWAVNGSKEGAVRLVIEPATTARVLFVSTSLRELYVSLEQPEAFAASVQPIQR